MKTYYYVMLAIIAGCAPAPSITNSNSTEQETTQDAASGSPKTSTSPESDDRPKELTIKYPVGEFYNSTYQVGVDAKVGSETDSGPLFATILFYKGKPGFLTDTIRTRPLRKPEIEDLLAYLNDARSKYLSMNKDRAYERDLPEYIFDGNRISISIACDEEGKSSGTITFSDNSAINIMGMRINGILKESPDNLDELIDLLAKTQKAFEPIASP